MATYVKASDIIARLIRLSGQVPGQSVQLYSQDVLLDMIGSTSRFVARKCWWPHLMDWVSGTLDGTTGVVTTNFSGIDDHTDIRSVFIDSNTVPLAMRSDEDNPFNTYQRLTYEALPVTDANYLTRLIRVRPTDTTGTLSMRVRKVPTISDLGSTVPFDQDLIVAGVLWQYFEDEGDNPQQAGKYRSLFDAKFTELMANISSHKVPMRPSGGTGLWRESVY